MAVTDMLPVLFFSISVAVLSGRIESVLFLAGAALVITAGTLKVLWKFVLALGKKDVPFLNRQLRYLMPAGFALLAAGLIVDRDCWSAKAAMEYIFSFPAGIFFLLAAVGIGCMIWFAGHLNGRDARSNWIEQGTNALTQFFLMMGIVL